jgi:pimeloyl-ACP methyl ester carboxylesterase
VLLLHAGVGDRTLWDDQLAPFSERHLVVRPDLPGFGESPLPDEPFSYVECIPALLDHLEIDKAAIVGNSFGGKIAIDTTLTHPERVRALVLVAAALTGWEASPELVAVHEEEEALLNAGKIEEAVALNVGVWLDGQRHGRASVPAGARERLADLLRGSFEAYLAASESSPPVPIGWSEPPAITRLDEIAVPTLVVSCTHDLYDFRAIGELLAEGIPNAEHAVLETAHLPAFEQPEEFNRLALAFLAQTSS